MRAVVILAMGLGLGGCATFPHLGHRSGQLGYAAYLRGLMLERDGKFSEALNAYRTALKHDDTSAYLHVRIGATYAKLGEMEQAGQTFQRALSLDPKHPEALRMLAVLQVAEGRLPEAIEAHERLLAVRPGDPEVLGALADLYVLQGRIGEAIALYERLIIEQGPVGQLHFNLGVLYSRINQFPQALFELSRALELARHFPEELEQAHVALGLTYELSGNLEQAAAHYVAAAALNPLNPRLCHHAARALASVGRTKEAVLQYQTALDLNPRDVDAVLGLVRLWVDQREFATAHEFLGQQLDAFGHPPALYIALGLLYREATYGLEALRAFERAIERKATYAQGYFYLAAQLDQLGNKAATRTALRRTLELEPDHADALNYLGYLDAEAGVNLEEAKALIQRALKLDPDNGAYLDSLGWVYYQLGDYAQAVTLLEAAIAQLSTDAIIFDHLGDAYWKQGAHERARAAWQRALELDPQQQAIQEKLTQETMSPSAQGTHTAP